MARNLRDAKRELGNSGSEARDLKERFNDLRRAVDSIIQHLENLQQESTSQSRQQLLLHSRALGGLFNSDAGHRAG
jgi:hypothetical protein